MIKIGFLPRGQIIWDKSASAGSSTAWGSFQSASNPCLRDIHEYILVFSKGSFKLSRTEQEKKNGRENTIEKQEFIDLTKSIWNSYFKFAVIRNPFSKAVSEFNFQDNSEGTIISWSMSGRVDAPLGGYVNLLMDDMIGSVFEKGLIQFKQYLEDAKAQSPSS